MPNQLLKFPILCSQVNLALGTSLTDSMYTEARTGMLSHFSYQLLVHILISNDLAPHILFE